MLTIFDAEFLINHLLYFGLVFIATSVVLIVLMTIKLNKCDKKRKEAARQRRVDDLRRISAHSTTNERKKLEF
jgi:hypothetical protein